MKTTLEPEDIQAIATAVMERLKPVISGNGKHEDDTVFDVKGLCDYLHVSDKWIYERTHLKEIPHLKVNGLLRFRRRDIIKWLNTFNVPAVSIPERILKTVK